MKADVFVPKEPLSRGRLYVVYKGCVRNRKHMLMPYSSFGITDVMLTGKLVIRPEAFSLTYVHTLSVKREDVCATARAHRC